MTAPSRESFFALYWDHSRERARLSVCLLAGFPSADISDLLAREWDTLMIWERDKLRRALLDFMAVHDSVRAEAARSRELRGERVAA